MDYFAEKYESSLLGYDVLKFNPDYLVNVDKGTIIKKKTNLLVGKNLVTFNKKHFMRGRLIWEQKNGPIPEGYEVKHTDGNVLNNSITNLFLARVIAT